ncbi:putative serine/threonine-protein kinase iks1 [Tritrichomonas musculus]|uniref:Serine/threonine-protein kinase iks1 n=1 Tax=Tritrichomonas musculus TaxID=1915356 RepID=A0ABR2JLT2_9EUKA
MDQLVAVNRSNWKVVFRSNDNRIVLYNQHLNEFRTTDSTSTQPGQWSSISYFHILENYLMNRSNENEEPLSEFLLDGYFNKYFTIQKKIGLGGAGSVYHVKHHLAGYTLAEYAVKIVPIGVFSRLKSALSEVQFLQKLSLTHHPFILGYYHCWIENFQPAMLGPKVPCLFILMEYSKYGNLDVFLHKNKKINYKSKWQIFIQILLAIHLLHKEKIIHRDLKMSNILVFDDVNINNKPLNFKFVLSDFGTSISEENQKAALSTDRTGATGTIETMAPELLEQNLDGNFIHKHTFSSDIWSLGVIAFNIFIGKNPFISENGEEILRNFTNVDNLLKEIGIYNSNIPNEIMSLIKKMMVKRSYLRISIEELIKDPTVIHYIHEFNYDLLIFNSNSSKKFDDHPPDSNSLKSALLPFRPSSAFIRDNNTNAENRNNSNFTEEEFHRSIPLSIKYSPVKKKSGKKEKRNRFKTKQKFYIILIIALACMQFPFWGYYILHLLLISFILFLSSKEIYIIYTLPIFACAETLIFQNNSYLLSLLILTLTIFITDAE